MGTVAKALSLLRVFSHSRSEIGLSDMARLSGLNKATVYRLLGELQDGGFVEQTAGGRAYRLGPEVLRLAALREATVPLLTVTRSVLERLTKETGETSHVSFLQGHSLAGADFRYSDRHATRVMMDGMDELAFHGTASGLAVLAYAEEAMVEDILNSPLERYTDKTPTDAASVRDVLNDVRRRGYSESIGLMEDDVHSYAAPIFGADGSPVGAIAVAAPANRIGADSGTNLPQAVKAAAMEATQATGGAFPPGYPKETKE